MAALYKLLPHTAPTAVALYVIGAALCVGLAVVLNRWVERPAMRLSARFKRPTTSPGVVRPFGSGTRQQRPGHG